MNQITTLTRTVAGKEMTLENGRIARQAGGSVTCRVGDTMVFAAATMAPPMREGLDFFPLTVDYRESRYAAGKFPGGFFKREGRPSERETLISRCIDRPIRPLFPEGFNSEVQVLLNVISFDTENEADICAMIAAFAALEISDIPFSGGIGAVRIGCCDSQLIVNPTMKQIADGSMNLTIAGTRHSIVMVEGGAAEVSEETLLEAFDLAQSALRELIDAIDEFRRMCGKTKIEFLTPEKNAALQARVAELAAERIKEANIIPDKHERQAALDDVLQDITDRILAEKEVERQTAIQRGEISVADPEALLIYKKRIAEISVEIAAFMHDLEKEIVRRRILDEGLRSDSRRPNEIRPITCELGVIPRAHGSALFTRGQTQALVSTTLGTISDEQKIDGLTEDYFKKFMLHYNFPPYSVGEVRPLRSPGRREVGHGALAERSLTRMIPEQEAFPYTIRVVSEILESNGSSSMASVCGGTLSLMDAGVPIKSPVAGIAMGLVKEGDRYAILSDILGVEDHLGDMDFKVTGTRQGITAFQMDLKIEGVSRSIMAEALEQARQGRIHILGIMEQAIASPRERLSPYAPRIQIMTIPVDKIRDVIGPGGKMIRKIISETGAKIDIDDDGRVVIASMDEVAGNKAKEWIDYLTEEVEIGKIYKGKVTRIVNFGAFVEVLPGQEGLVHISEIGEHRINRVEDVLNEGDETEVKVIEIDDFGRINLSKRQADMELGRIPMSSGKDRGDRGGRSGGGDRGDRGGRDRGDRGDRGGRNDRGGRDRGGRGGHGDR
ncbi:MAG: polyribonucleotide nucleotidyltransferase [Candidatus Omnitrophota bacterium]